MARVVFIDKLIRSEHGHNLEYCTRQAPFFKLTGYSAVILGNKAYKGVRPGSAELKPVIEFDFQQYVGGPGLFQRLREQFGKRWGAFLTKAKWEAHHSLPGIAYLILLDLRDGAVSLRQLGPWSIPVGLIAGMLAVLRVLTRLAFLPIRWTRRVLGLVWQSRPLGFVRGFVRGIASQVAAAAKIDATSRSIIGNMLSTFFERRQQRATARSISRELVALRLEDDDLVVWTTATERELALIGTVLEQMGPKARGIWHGVFREPIFLQEHKNFTASQSQRGLRVLLMRIHSLIGDRARFWADTTELAEQYSSLEIYRFGVLGIPVPDEIAHGGQLRETSGARGPLTLGYVGDARPEKGFVKLPDLVQSLAISSETRPNVNYLVQTNFNVPKGVSATRAARLRLEHMDNLGVRTIDRPQTSAEYSVSILATDIMLLNYDSMLYFAGSSGILAEALVGGRPVVVTDKTWGGRVLRNSDCYRAWMKALARTWGVSSSKLIEAPADVTVGPHNFRITSVATTVAAPPEIAIDRWTAIPSAATHAIIIARFKRQAVADAVKITLAQASTFGAEQEATRYLSAEAGEATAIVPMVENVRRLKASVWRLDARQAPEDCEISIVLAKVPEGTPISAGGVTIAGDAEYPAAVLEICTHYEHYRRTASTIGASLREEHNVERIVSAIVASSRGESPGKAACPEPQIATGAGHDQT